MNIIELIEPSGIITLLFILDPFGNAPIFLSLLKRYEPRRRRIIIVREMLIALLILIIFLLFGNYILKGMNISHNALNLSGAIILFLIAINMIFPSKEKEENTEQEPLIVPMAIPLVAGPSSIAMVMLYSTKEPEKILHWFLAILIAWSISFIFLFFSDYMLKILGIKVLNAIERLMGMVLTTMAVEMLLRGIKELFREIRY